MTSDMVQVPPANPQRQLTVQDQKLGRMRQLISTHMKALTSVLPAHIKPERLARITLTTLQKNPKLLDCTPESFLGCILSCAALGLEPDGLLGQAYLIPYKQTCTLIPGYKGLVKLARQSGEVATIDAHEVRVGDIFEYNYGAHPSIRHVPEQAPFVNGENGRRTISSAWRPGEITHFYAVAVMRDGTTQFTVMQAWEVDEIRNGSSGYQNAIKYKDNSHPWIAKYPEMGKKTAIRRLCKLLPASVDKPQLHQAIAIDERAEVGAPQDLEFIADIPAIPVSEEPQQESTQEQPKDETPPQSLSEVAAKSKEARAK